MPPSQHPFLICKTNHHSVLSHIACLHPLLLLQPFGWSSECSPIAITFLRKALARLTCRLSLPAALTSIQHWSSCAPICKDLQTAGHVNLREPSLFAVQGYTAQLLKLCVPGKKILKDDCTAFSELVEPWRFAPWTCAGRTMQQSSLLIATLFPPVIVVLFAKPNEELAGGKCTWC